MRAAKSAREGHDFSRAVKSPKTNPYFTAQVRPFARATRHRWMCFCLDYVLATGHGTLITDH
jgi:hypothetical protein